MSVFDAELFAQVLLEDVRGLVSDVSEDSCELQDRLRALELDLEATFAALEIEHDGARARGLRQDLDVYLPARKKSILAAAQAHVTTDIHGRLKEALDASTRAAVAVAKAFVMGGGL